MLVMVDKLSNKDVVVSPALLADIEKLRKFVMLQHPAIMFLTSSVSATSALFKGTWPELHPRTDFCSFFSRA